MFSQHNKSVSLRITNFLFIFQTKIQKKNKQITSQFFTSERVFASIAKSCSGNHVSSSARHPLSLIPTLTWKLQYQIPKLTSQIINCILKSSLITKMLPVRTLITSATGITAQSMLLLDLEYDHSCRLRKLKLLPSWILSFLLKYWFFYHQILPIHRECTSGKVA